MLNKLLATRRA